MKATAHARPALPAHRQGPRPPARASTSPPTRAATDTGPSPQELLAASLASCTAVTMEMYAERKGWDIGGVEVACDYTPAERGCPTRFNARPALPATA